MNNKIIMERPLRRRLLTALIAIVVFMVAFAINLLVLRAISAKNYSGHVNEVLGVVEEVNHDEDDDGVSIVVNGTRYNANTVARFTENLRLDELLNQTVTLYTTQTQVGNTPWVLGIKQGDELLADYESVIAAGKEENKEVMTVFGICAGISFVAACGVYVWRLRVPATAEYDLAQKYSEYSFARQPNCPEYKWLWKYILIYLSYTLIYAIVTALVGSVVKNTATQIAVSVSLSVVFVVGTVGVFAVLNWVVKKEREFYVKNFPFDFTDVSHVFMRKKFKEQLQAELNAEHAEHPHRYGDGGNGYTVEFSDTGLKFYLYDEYDEEPSAESVFGEQEGATKYLCTVDYATLNFEALPFYRKKDHPLTVVIKSRLNDWDLPDELKPSSTVERINDVHIVLDSNLLASLRQFDVSVENLQYILDNKEQLIQENCSRRKK